MEQELEIIAQEVCELYDYDDVNLLPILQEVQQRSKGNYINEEMARIISKKLKITESRVYDVITYFSALSSEPRGENIVQICNSTTCGVNNNQDLVNWFEQELAISMGETTKDNKFTLIYTHCIGACDTSPSVRINHEVYGDLNRKRVREIIASKRGK
ncbi:MAG: NAD(P)H-dependent oxidoreductase subunit E [Eubacteriales bacterium]